VIGGFGSATAVVTCGWKSSSLDRLADICESKDRYGKPLHKGKTVWIDVLITRQFSTDEEALDSQQAVQITAATHGSAFEHLVVADMAPDGGSILDRAWCLAELATTTSTDGILMTVVGDWAAVKARLAAVGIDCFLLMVATVLADVELVPRFARERFGSAEGFNRAVHAGVVGKLEAAHLYNEGCDHYYGSNGKAEDEARGLALLLEAARLGHPEAAYMVGLGYGSGEVGLEQDNAMAVRYYRQAAEGGSRDGLERLAVLYRCGSGGLPRDEAAAARLYGLAADMGEYVAMADLGGMLETGQGGVARDAGRAVELYRLALATKLGKNGPVYQRCVEGLGRLGADGGSGAALARLERARLARYDAARRREQAVGMATVA
jgi:hypothetical protein